MPVVYADMVGDLFHAGHINFFKKLRKMGTSVIIGLNSDEDVLSYKRKPIMNLDERKAVIEACRYVDKVIAPCPLVITEQFLYDNQIDLVVHAHDEGDRTYDFMYKIPMKLGKFRRVDYTDGISTSDIIRRCQSRK